MVCRTGAQVSAEMVDLVLLDRVIDRLSEPNRWAQAHPAEDADGKPAAWYDVVACLLGRTVAAVASQRARPRWSQQFTACVSRGTCDQPHQGQGLCRTCYKRVWQQRKEGRRR